MIKYGKLFLLTIILLISTSLKERDIIVKAEFTQNSVLPTTPVIPKKPKPIKKIQKLTYKEFSYELAKLETGGIKEPYKAVNQYGYVGKYQFSKRTLRRLVDQGYLKATKQEIRNFRDLPDVQERAMEALIAHNIRILSNYGLKKYVGKKVDGITITMEGMLAGAHLLGPYAVKHFVKTGGSMSSVRVGGVLVKKYDGNGTSIKKYLSKFQNV